MKKLVLFFAVAVAVSFASCGQKAAETEVAPVDSSAVVVEEAPVADSTVVADSAAVEAAPAEVVAK